MAVFVRSHLPHLTGHDAFETTSWPRFFERRLRPLWEKLSVEFVVRNHAVGGRNPNPWSLCLAPMLGEDSDVIMREWEYWQFDHGFRNLPIARQGADTREAAIEILLRTAFSLRNQVR